MSAEAPRQGTTPPDGGLPPTGENKEGRFAGKIAVIPGSRDLGGALARAFAAEGGIVITSFRSNRRRASAFREEMDSMGATFELVEEVDITTADGLQKLVEAAAKHQTDRNPEQGAIDFLFLNPAGSDERLNVDAQDKLLQAFVPLMASGSVVVEEQSVPGGYYPVIKDTGLIPPGYKPAESKHEGQRKRRQEWLPFLNAKGIKMLTLIIPAVKDSWMAQTIARRDPQAIENNARYSEMLGLRPSILSSEVAATTLNRLAEGIRDDDLEMFGPHLDGRYALDHLYGEPAIYVDTKNIDERVGRMIATPERVDTSGQPPPIDSFEISQDKKTIIAKKRITAEDTENHLLIGAIWAGHRQFRSAMATIRELAGANEGAPVSIAPINVNSIDYGDPILPGQTATITAEFKDATNNLAIFKVSISAGGEHPTVMDGFLVSVHELRDESHLLPPDILIEGAGQSAALGELAKKENVITLRRIKNLCFVEDVGIGSVVQYHDSNGRKVGNQYKAETEAVVNGVMVMRIDEIEGTVMPIRLLTGIIRRAQRNLEDKEREETQSST